MVDGQGRDDEVEGAGGQRVEQVGHPQRHVVRRQALPGHRQHPVALIQADGAGGGVQRQDPVQGLPGAGAQVEDGHRVHRRGGVGDRLLQMVVVRDLLAHPFPVGGRVEMVVAHGPSISRMAARVHPTLFAEMGQMIGGQ
jgi:hypothetical protein